jgi:N-acetylneuraminate synthase
MAGYQSKNLGDDYSSQQDMLRRLVLPPEAFVRLAQYCAEKKIDFLCTPFDAASLDYLLKNTQMRYLKLSSGELTNGPFLLAAARSGVPVVLSTGMSNLEEIGEALSVLHFGITHEKGFPKPSDIKQPTAQMLEELNGKVVLLHCVSQYPAPLQSTNLQALDTMRKTFGLPVGLSDHTQGIAAAAAAAARGAVMLEKHFTYDVNATGPDHKASLSPLELKTMVMVVRGIERAMGDGQKTCLPIEENTRSVARKSLVAKRSIVRDEVFTKENLVAKRPSTGELQPNDMFALLGKTAKRDYAADDFIQRDELDN